MPDTVLSIMHIRDIGDKEDLTHFFQRNSDKRLFCILKQSFHLNLFAC